MRDRRYGWTVEMQVRALQLRARVAEVPVRYRRRVGKSKISGTVTGILKAGWWILYTIFKYARPQAPRSSPLRDDASRGDAARPH